MNTRGHLIKEQQAFRKLLIKFKLCFLEISGTHQNQPQQLQLLFTPEGINGRTLSPFLFISKISDFSDFSGRAANLCEVTVIILPGGRGRRKPNHREKKKKSANTHKVTQQETSLVFIDNIKTSELAPSCPLHFYCIFSPSPISISKYEILGFRGVQCKLDADQRLFFLFAQGETKIKTYPTTP